MAGFQKGVQSEQSGLIERGGLKRQELKLPVRERGRTEGGCIKGQYKINKK